MKTIITEILTGKKWAFSSVSKWSWIALSVLTAALIIKSIYFRQMLGMDDSLSVWQTVTAYIAVTAVALGLGLIAWSSWKWSALLLLILTDLWFIAGIWYYSANTIWLNWHALCTVSELHGFESSIRAYLSWSQLLLPLTTFLSWAFLRRIPYIHEDERARLGVLSIALCGCLCAAGGRLLFPMDEHTQLRSFHAEQTYFICTHSPLAQIGLIGYEAAKDGLFRWHATRPFTPREQEIMDSIYRDSVPPHAPEGHLVYILVESLETWALEATDINGSSVCPYLNAYIQTHPVLYVPGIETLQKYGRSGDGQLIVQTGLLPISSGVACKQFGTNTYPNLAHFYSHGIVINPYHVPVWNQRVVTYSYGFQRLISPRRLHNEKDRFVMQRTREHLMEVTEPTVVLALTIDTHAPFQTSRDSLTLDDRYSSTEKDYLCSAHYTDRQIGQFLAWSDTASVMQNATIVITADHNHFPRTNGHGLCPLILSSPRIKESVFFPHALQMDIFPTVLHAIGQDDYMWRGFGIDLLSPNAPSLLQSRSITLEEAYSLSDKLIQTNYFAQ